MQCPKCASENVHAEKRGWSMVTGFIGSGKIALTCLDCGKRFKPGKQARTELSQREAVIGLIAVFAILLLLAYIRSL